MSIQELGISWSVVNDLLFGTSTLVAGILCLLAVKIKWDRFLLPDYNPLARMLGREFAESTTLFVGILLVVIGGLLLVKAGLAFF